MRSFTSVYLTQIKTYARIREFCAKKGHFGANITNLRILAEISKKLPNRAYFKSSNLGLGALFEHIYIEKQFY